MALTMSRATARAMARSMARAIAGANAGVYDRLGLTGVPTLGLMQKLQLELQLEL
jgi:hypothetical protein